VSRRPHGGNAALGHGAPRLPNVDDLCVRGRRSAPRLLAGKAGHPVANGIAVLIRPEWSVSTPRSAVITLPFVIPQELAGVARAPEFLRPVIHHGTLGEGRA
jgi:hypothetical protein